MRFLRFFPAVSILFALLTLWPQGRAVAQETGGRVVLALPFENRSGQPALDWVGESFAETFNLRLRSSGFLTISRDDRVYALDHLGLPTGLRPSRATTLRIAQTLDAQFVVVGHYTVKDATITAEAQVVEVNRLTMTQPVTVAGALPELLTLENSLAWRCARLMDSTLSVAEGTFIAASQGLKLDAYESYIRGVSAPSDDERLKRLKSAVDLAPNDPQALLALGKTEYASGDFDGAAAVLGRVPGADPLALEAGFYLGLARFNNARYAEAEQAFAAVAAKLPLPEVVNDEGVAQARQRKDATALLQNASAGDPLDAEYHFNVAVALRRKGDVQRARGEAEQAVKLKASDAEFKQLAAAMANPAMPATGFDPQERIRRSYSEAAFRQAAFQVDQLRAARTATLPSNQRAAVYAQTGEDYLSQGLVLEAEREFQSALATDLGSPEAHLGIAEVRERSGNRAEARSEANVSLQLKPTAAAYLVLARADVAENQLAAAASDVGNALRLEPANASAMSLRANLQARGVNVP